MSINFNRNRTQVLYENLIGVTNPEELLSKKTEFKNYTLKNSDVYLLKQILLEDAVDFFYSGIISFAEGIDSLFEKRFSWATVKLYYSIFYLLRASMASKGTAILRCNSMFRLSIKRGESPYNTTNKKYNATHQGTINHYKDVFGQDDKILSNKIDDKDAYEWMQDVREIVNYRSAAFEEPECLNVWDSFVNALEDGSINNLLLTLQNDPDYIYCFQEEFAIVGIPIKRVIQTIMDFQTAGILSQISTERRFYAKDVFAYNSRELQILDIIFAE